MTADLTDPNVEATPETRRLVTDLMWAENTDALYDRFRCGCCCHEHTRRNCPARLWGGCRGQG